MKQEVELPLLPGRLVWEYEESYMPLVRSNLSTLHILRLKIIRKWGWLRKDVLVGDWFPILPGSVEDKEAAIHMQCDMLVLQLPDKFHAKEFSDAS